MGDLLIIADDFTGANDTGVQHIKGIPVSKTEIGKDPKKPVTEDNITKLLKKGLQLKFLNGQMWPECS